MNPGVKIAAAPPRASREAVAYLIAISVFLIAAGLTLWFCISMSGGMDMPGGWSMSMMWMPMPGQTWLAAAGMFGAMWLAMMVAMMLPSAMPTMIVYRRVLCFRHEPHATSATVLMAGGYFLVWLAFGVVAYIIGAGICWAAMRWEGVSRAIPILSGVALVLCGLFQFSPMKMACLGHCRDPMHTVASHLRPGRSGGFLLGLHHGVFCAICCWGLMVIQLALGVMNLGIMVLVGLVISLEKLVPRARWIVWSVGVGSIGGGAGLIAYSLLRPFIAGGAGVK